MQGRCYYIQAYQIRHSIDIARVDLQRINNYHHIKCIGFNTIKPRYIDKTIKFINLLLAKNNDIKFEFIVEKYTHCPPIQRVIEKTNMMDIVIFCNSIRSPSHKDVKFDFPLPRKLTIKTKDTYYFTDLICKKNKIHDYFFLQLESAVHWVKDVSIIDELMILNLYSEQRMNQPELFTNLKALHICINYDLFHDIKTKIHKWIKNIPHLSKLYINKDHVTWMNAQEPKKILYVDNVFVCVNRRDLWSTELPLNSFNDLFKYKNNRNIPRVFIYNTNIDDSKLFNMNEIRFYNFKRHLIHLPKSFIYSILYLYSKKKRNR